MSSHNDWDPLEEAIVGVVEDAAVPDWEPAVAATMPPRSREFFLSNAGRGFPPELVAQAARELEGLCGLLEREGVTVRRPEPLAFARPYATPDWCCAGGLYAAMPRDVALVIGDQLIEAPMAWRARHFEIHAYRALFCEYFRRGARWVAAPRPRLADALYDRAWEAAVGTQAWVTTELEPTFDAADFVRLGRDILVQRSQVTNRLGIEWLRRHLGDGYRVHELRVNDRRAMHIDATFVPLAPGRALVNPERMGPLPALLREWEALPAPPPVPSSRYPLHMSSAWLSINLLSLDPGRAIVEREQAPLIAALRRWGVEAIPCALRAVNAFGGSFHCVTLDVRRRGALQSHL